MGFIFTICHLTHHESGLYPTGPIWFSLKSIDFLLKPGATTISTYNALGNLANLSLDPKGLLILESTGIILFIQWDLTTNQHIIIIK